MWWSKSKHRPNSKISTMDNKLSQHCILARGYNSPGLLTNSGVSLLMKKNMLFSESF